MSALVDFANSTVAVIRPQFGVIVGSKTATISKRKSIATPTFVGIITFAIAASMVGVIFLQALVAKSAFQKIELSQQRTALVAERALLMQRAAELESPVALRTKAQQLGMVVPERPTYLRLSDQKLLDGRRNR